MKVEDLKPGVIYVGTYVTNNNYIFSMINSTPYDCIGVNLNAKKFRKNISLTACKIYREATEEEKEIFNLSIQNNEYTEPNIMGIDDILAKLNL
jgi:hypothetical protein